MEQLCFDRRFFEMCLKRDLPSLEISIFVSEKTAIPVMFPGA